MDPQVSYMRLLIGDNVPPYTYTDAQLRNNVRISPPPTSDPRQVQIAGVLAFRKFPSDISGGPFTGPF